MAVYLYVLVKASILRGFLNKDVVERLIRHEQVPYQPLDHIQVQEFP